MSLSRICTWLWVSGAPSANDLVQLAQQGVTLDIDTTAECQDVLPPTMRRIKLGWVDDGLPKPVADFSQALVQVGYQFVMLTNQRIAGVLVHCGAGVNRGPMMATFLLAAFSGTDSQATWQRVIAAHPDARGYNVPAYRQSIDNALQALGPA